MPDQSTVRIFISSPTDVRPERLKAEQIIARLDREFAYHFHVEAVLWERAPLVATHHFQDPENIPQPRRMDIVVVILWSRLGVPLPEDRFKGAISGRPVTGTEWEFEDALAGARERGVPELLLYRKTARITADLDDEAALEQRRAQRSLVQDFVGRWFRADSGPGYTAASHNFTTTGEFEQQLYDHLHALLERRAGAAGPELAIRWHEAPFRALLPYEYEHAPVFFGRTRARNELRELLARRIEGGAAFVLVFGASGSGKSSLVKAGLLPDLSLPGMIGQVGSVRRGVMRPSERGGDLLAVLAAAILSPTALPELAGLQYRPQQLAALLREAPSQAALPIRQGLVEAGKAEGLTDIAEARLVVVIDQLEEVFTIEGLSEGDREAFVAAIDTLTKSGLVWVLATMRSDFFDRLETRPGLALARLAIDEACYRLLPPDEAEIGQIIRQPALEAGLRFEHDAASGVSLDEVIRQAAGDTGALPLLSFLLDQLWQRRTGTGLLTFAAYRELGGLEGAIGRRAEEVFQAQPEAVRKELVLLLRELVTIEGGKPVSRAVPLSRFPESSPQRALTEAFLDPGARLLVSDGDSSRAQLRLAHEALLTHWPRARDQIAADTWDLELRRRLEEEAKEWRAAASRREKKGRVRPAGLPLKEARALLARWGTEFPAEISEFIAASRRASWWRRLRLAMTVVGSVTAPPVIVLLLWAGVEWRSVRRVEAGLRFVAVPAGCFEMGSPDSETRRNPNEGPVHRVCLASFELGEFEVTQKQWRGVMLTKNSYFKGNQRRPVESVSWDEAQTFIRWMSFFGRHHYRLPSEAEYEYAERAGTTTPYYWGSRLEDACAHENVADLSAKKEFPEATVVNCDDGYSATAPVGSFKPNPWGFYDMDGNVGSWVEDCYVDNYRQAPRNGNAVAAKDCKARVVRGGAANYYDPHILRSAFRAEFKWFAQSNLVGFRLVRISH